MILLIGSGLMAGFFPAHLSRLVYGLGGTTAALLTTFLFLRLQKSSFVLIGLSWVKRTLGRFILGALIGSMTLAIMLSLLYVLTGIKWEKSDLLFSSATIVGYIAILPLAFMEELAFRSYPFVILQRRYGIWVAQFVTAVAFALYHIPGGNGLLGVLLGPGIWGLVYGLSAAWSRGIAVPFGIHVALNAGQMMMGMKGTEQAIYKISNSTHTIESPKFEFNDIGLAMQLAILVIAICLTFYYTKKQKQDIMNPQADAITLR